jgi:hypothetical protein
MLWGLITGLQPGKIELWIDAINAPYVITSSLHHTQRLIKRMTMGVSLSMAIA